MLYAPAIKDVVDGHLIVNDPAIFENKGRPSFLVPLFPTLFLGVMSILLGSVQMTFIAGSFIFPFIIFLLVYFLFHKSTKSVNASILASFSVVLGFNFIANPPVTSGVIQFYLGRIFLQPIEAINYIGRLPHIQFIFIWLLLAVIFLYMTLEKKRMIYAVAGGIVLGMLFYSYFYYWTSVLAAAGILFLVSLLKRDFRSALNIFIIAAAGVAIAAPYLLNLAGLAATEMYKDIGSRLGIETGFDILQPVKYLVVYLVFACLVRKRNAFFWVMTSFFIAGIALLNMQVVTGFNIQGRHYDTALLAPLSVMMLIYAFREFLMNTHKNAILSAFSGFVGNNSKRMLVFIVALLIFISVYSHAAYSFNAYKTFGLDREYAEAYMWLNGNTEPESVVLTMSVEHNALIPVYTRNNVFVPNGFFSPVTDEEIMERLFIAYKIFGVTPGYLGGLMDNEDLVRKYNGMREDLEKTDVALFEKSYWNTYTFHEKFVNEDIVQSELLGETSKAGIYNAMIDYYKSFTPDLNKYRVDYIFEGEYERSVSGFAAPPGFRLLWSNGKVSIYGKS